MQRERLGPLAIFSGHLAVFPADVQRRVGAELEALGYGAIWVWMLAEEHAGRERLERRLAELERRLGRGLERVDLLPDDIQEPAGRHDVRAVFLVSDRACRHGVHVVDASPVRAAFWPKTIEVRDAGSLAQQVGSRGGRMGFPGGG